jgi:hypothetical protein
MSYVSRITAALILCAFVSVAAASGSVHVKGYTRKDGTYVAPYTRSAPGASSHSSSSGSSDASRHSSSAAYSGTAKRDAEGHIERSSAARGQFIRQHPCPANGKTSGACPGYVIDHIQPLKSGGRDAPDNMQWQTENAAKAKDKWE